MPLIGYLEVLEQSHNIIVSESFIRRWFKTIGTFKRSLRATSRLPQGRDSLITIYVLGRYLEFMAAVRNHERSVLADKKIMKELMSFGKVRVNIVDDVTPNHTMNANSKNRYNIFCAVIIKKG